MTAPKASLLVLFDLDGTLIDHDAAAAAAVEQWLLATGWASHDDLGDLVSVWDEVAEAHFPAYRAGHTSFQGQRRARLRDFLPRLGIDADRWADERLDAAFADYLAAYEAAWRPFPDAVPCLQALLDLGDAAVAVLSNGDQAQQEAKIARTGLGPYVSTVLTSGALGVAKPNPRIFEAACEALTAQPGQTVYVGDRLEVDAQAATAAGLRGIWLNRHADATPDAVESISSLELLPALLR